MLSAGKGDHSRSACRVCVLTVTSSCTSRKNCIVHRTWGKESLTGSAGKNLCNMDQLFTWGDQQQICASVCYCESLLPMLDLARPPSPAPFYLAISSSLSAQKRAQGSMPWLQPGSCLLIFTLLPALQCSSLLCAQGAQLPESQSRAL